MVINSYEEFCKSFDQNLIYLFKESSDSIGLIRNKKLQILLFLFDIPTYLYKYNNAAFFFCSLRLNNVKFIKEPLKLISTVNLLEKNTQLDEKLYE